MHMTSKLRSFKAKFKIAHNKCRTPDTDHPIYTEETIPHIGLHAQD